MAAGLQRFGIKLHKSNNTFVPGEMVSGNVIVGLARTKSLQALKVRIKGTAKVEWRESSRNVYHRAEEQYFRLEAVLLRDHKSGHNVNIEAGYHMYPFSFCLPHNIPSSFECTGGSVRYAIKAIMDRPWKLDHQTRLAFTVEAPFDLNEVPAARRNMSDEGQEFFCGFPCLSMGSVKYHFHLPARDFAIGEPIEATFKIDNNSRSVDVIKLKLTLEQNITLFARTEKKKLQKVIQTKQRLGAFDKKIYTTLNLKIPVVPLSNLKHCGIIDIQYRLVFNVGVSGFHHGPSRDYLILIGTRSLPSLQQNEHGTPSLDQASNYLEPNESNVPSAPIISETTVSQKISFQMPMMHHQLRNPPYPMPMNNERFGNPNSSGATNQPYPQQLIGAPFGYQSMATNQPIGFIGPHAVRPKLLTELLEKPTPS